MSSLAVLDQVNALDTPYLRLTMGAVLLGGFVSVFLSGIVTMQVYLYYRMYGKDAFYLKAMVTMVWLLDLLHTIMVTAANWTYLIAYFGSKSESNTIVWSVAVTIALTAIVTFIVHCFFVKRIHTVSKSNWFLTSPLALLALFRLAIAIATTAEMIRTGSFTDFVAHFKWMFTMGLAASAVLDVAIAFFLSFYLRKGKSGFSSMDQIIDVLILYTVETGLVTCVMTIASLVCWLAMTHNLVYLALHFTISKLYANSFLATLNSRKTLKIRSQASSDKDRGHALPILFPSRRQTARDPLGTRTMEISIQRTIHTEVDGRMLDVPLDDTPSQMEDDGSSDKRSMHFTL